MISWLAICFLLMGLLLISQLGTVVVISVIGSQRLWATLGTGAQRIAGAGIVITGIWLCLFRTDNSAPSPSVAVSAAAPVAETDPLVTPPATATTDAADRSVTAEVSSAEEWPTGPIADGQDARPAWVDGEADALQLTNMVRVTAAGDSRAEVERLLSIEEGVAMHARLIQLLSAAGELDESPELVLTAADREHVNIERYFAPAEDELRTNSHRAWSLIHFLPSFQTHLTQRVVETQARQRLHRLTAVGGATLLVLCFSFGYLHVLRRLPPRLITAGLIAWLLVMATGVISVAIFALRMQL